MVVQSKREITVNIKFIKLMRTLSNKTQAEVAKEMNMAIKTYRKKENNIEKFTIEELKKISHILSFKYESIYQ